MNQDLERAQADAQRAAQAIVDEIRKLLAGHYEGVDDDILKVALLRYLLYHDQLIDLLKDLDDPPSLKLSDALLDWRDAGDAEEWDMLD